MTLLADSAANRAACVAQCYGDWHGWYVLQRLVDGAWWDVRQLSRDEALTYRCAGDEALEVVWPQSLTSVL